MSEDILNLIRQTLTNHYGATKIVVDKEWVIVYGVDIEIATLAVQQLLADKDYTVTHVPSIMTNGEGNRCVLQISPK